MLYLLEEKVYCEAHESRGFYGFWGFPSSYSVQTLSHYCIV